MAIDVRSADTADLDRIEEVVAEALEPEDAEEARMVLEDPAFDRSRWLVAGSDGGVESTMALLDSHFRIGAARFPAGQVEFVATSQDARGKGLVRAQLEELHARSAAAGHLLQLIVGIPFFYRQFGYSYAIPQQAYQMVGRDVALAGGDWRPRTAELANVPALATAQADVQAEAGVAATHPEQLWKWLIASPNYEVVIAEHRDQVAAGRIYLDGDTALLGDVVAPTRAALHALIAHARDLEPSVAVAHRPASMLSAMLTGLGSPVNELGWYYVRVPDEAALLEVLRPELEARLARSPLDGFTGTFTLSTYVASVTCEIEEGRFGPMTSGGPIPYPVSEGGSGVPPDLFPRLLLSPLGALELERLNGDVLLGDQRDLMAALFPPVTSDIQTWVFI
jgi:predicted N-acetyltransferase YhbS